MKVFGDPDTVVPFIEGMYIEADVLTGKTTAAYLPEKAVIQEGERYVVLVKSGEKDGNMIFRKVVVRTGRTENGRVEILNPGVIGGHEVLVEGAYFLL